MYSPTLIFAQLNRGTLGEPNGMNMILPAEFQKYCDEVQKYYGENFEKFMVIYKECYDKKKNVIIIEDTYYDKNETLKGIPALGAILWDKHIELFFKTLHFKVESKWDMYGSYVASDFATSVELSV